jgi:hypothetical protein
LISVLALIVFRQSDRSADRVVSLQDVVKKTKPIRGAVSEIISQDDGVNDNYLENDGQSLIEYKPLEQNGEPKNMSVQDGSESDTVSADEAKTEGDNKTVSNDGETKPPPPVQENSKSKDKAEEIGEDNQASGADNSASKSTDKTNVELFPKKDSPVDYCSTMCSARVKQHKERWRGDLLNTKDLGRLVGEAREKLVARLKVDYGEDNYAKIFEDNGESRGKKAFVSASPKDGPSIARFKRKLKMKILTVQKAVREEQETFGGCDCKTGIKDGSHRDLVAADKAAVGDQYPMPDQYSRMVWATGGHSAAASHGNLWNESYTSFMEQAVTDGFGSIGIDFEGRNYAVGGTDSAPETAFCSEAVFGTDADVISWDFGMTDGRYWDRKGMYANRIGLNPNRPVIVDMNLDSKSLARQTVELRRVEEWGLTALYMDPGVYSAMKDGIPDTFGLTMEQINAMPRMVRHFKCQDAIEMGDPTCSANKFDNNEICPVRKGMVKWHPGW